MNLFDIATKKELELLEQEQGLNQEMTPQEQAAKRREILDRRREIQDSIKTKQEEIRKLRQDLADIT